MDGFSVTGTMARPRVIWFKHDHEQRNYWLRFGLMRLHARGEIRYIEMPLARCTEFDFSETVARHPEKASTVLLVEEAGTRRRVVVESNDSFLVMSGLIAEADLYFCAGYNRAFFEGRRYEARLAWQTPQEYERYAERAEQLLQHHGAHFHKVRPFGPIGPALEGRPVGRLRQRLRNLRHRLQWRMSCTLSWGGVKADFERRYADLLGLRRRPACYDVVLLDTLWGWPRHRQALHAALASLHARGRTIHSRLAWSPGMELDGSDHAHPDPAAFPMTIGRVENYEAMLAESRLAVFATGMHYGWRNIMTLAMMIGIPILADRTFIEPWFGLGAFDIAWNDAAGWCGIEEALDAMTDARRAAIAEHNIAVFDSVATPEALAGYLLRTVRASIAEAGRMAGTQAG
jgi:hypothetical protein